MSNNWRSLIILSLVVLAFGGLFLYFGNRGVGTQAPARLTDAPRTITRSDGIPQKGDLDYQEPDTTVTIGTKEVSRGRFEKVEGGSIFYEEEGVLTQVPLTADEVVLACTNQNLSSANVLDFDQVSVVNVVTPGEVGGRIPLNAPIVVFAQDVEGVFRAHTIAMSAAFCAE